MRSTPSLLPILLAAALAALVAAPPTAPAANWPSWRGPTADGISPETNAPTRWTRTQNVRWRFALQESGNSAPLPGNSTPIVWGDTVYLTQSIRSRRTLIALDRRNGRPRWTSGVEATGKEPTHASNPPCSASPVTDGERIIAWFGSEGVVAYDPSGKELWKASLGPLRHQFGYGSSPVLHGDRVFLNFGPGISEFVVALDKTTGRELWRAQAPTPGADDVYGTWSTPFVTEVDGRPQLLVALRDYFAGLDPATGREIWRCRGLGPQAKSSPLAANGVAVISGDLRSAELAVRLGGSGDVTETHRLWRENPPRRRVTTGIIRDGRLFGAQVNGLLDCIDLETGNVVWAERQAGSGANSAIWSSPILVGDLLYFNNQSGETIIVKAAKTFQQVAVNSLRETCNASPVLSDGDLFLRTHAALWCIREGAQAPGTASSPSTNRPSSR